jgi:hypothetical protein
MSAPCARHICGITTSNFCKRLIFNAYYGCLISMQKQNFLTDQRLGWPRRHLATILSTESVRKWIKSLVFRLLKNEACICFSKAIKHLACCAGLCSHCFPQFMCKACRLSVQTGASGISRRLLKNAAAGICPLNSNTLILIKALAHNLFHKICEEAHIGGQGTVPCHAAGLGDVPIGPPTRPGFWSGMGLYQSWRLH